jgi:hypothetical protein
MRTRILKHFPQVRTTSHVPKREDRSFVLTSSGLSTGSAKSGELTEGQKEILAERDARKMAQVTAMQQPRHRLLHDIMR